MYREVILEYLGFRVTVQDIFRTEKNKRVENNIACNKECTVSFIATKKNLFTLVHFRTFIFLLQVLSKGVESVLLPEYIFIQVSVLSLQYKS